MYDANGNRIKEIDPRYLAISEEQAPGIEYEYDALNRLVRTTAFDGKERTVISYKEYDGRSNVIKEADGEGYKTADPAKSMATSMNMMQTTEKLRMHLLRPSRKIRRTERIMLQLLIHTMDWVTFSPNKMRWGIRPPMRII